MPRLPTALFVALLVGCSSSGATTELAPVELGVVRIVDPARLKDPEEWGPELDLALETEFWDLIGNSDHARYPAWHSKAKAYVGANHGADPRLGMLVSAGAVFTLTTLFQHDDPLSQIGDYAEYIDDATVGIHDAVAPLGDHEPALVFFHNNQAMLAFLLTGNADLGICHLEKLRNLEDSNPSFHGTEGRAAAPFTYGMVHEEAYVDYGIGMMAWSPLAQGLLSGKITRENLKEGDHRLAAFDFLERIERAAFTLTGETYRVPAQRAGHQQCRRNK